MNDEKGRPMTYWGGKPSSESEQPKVLIVDEPRGVALAAAARSSEKNGEAVSDTPRTDAASCDVWGDNNFMHNPSGMWVPRKIARQLERELAAANRSLDWCGEQIKGCGQYTKEGETIFEALERNWTDSQNALGLFAKERIEKERLESALSATGDTARMEYLFGVMFDDKGDPDSKLDRIRRTVDQAIARSENRTVSTSSASKER